MPPRRSSSRNPQPAQRRPRTEKACNFCRIARQRCEPIEYATNDRPCRRCVSMGLDCNLPRAARSQSPSSTLGSQGSAPIRDVTPHSTDVATGELWMDPEATVQYRLPLSESVPVQVESWSPVMRSEGGQGSSPPSLVPGQNPLQVPGYLPRASSMEAYQQSFPNVTQRRTDPGYYTEGYYGQATSSDTFVADYGETDEASNLGHAMDEHSSGVFADEQDPRPSHSDDRPPGTGAYSNEQDTD